MPATGVAVLAALASLPGDAGSKRGAILFPDLPATRHILIDAEGRQHVVLRAGDAAVQLVVLGPDITAGPVSLVFLIDGYADLGASSRTFADLARMLSGWRSQKRPRRRWTPPNRRLRDTLIALDGHQAGASYRQIAEVIVGAERVKRDWHQGDLKYRIRRDVKRGLALMNGNYRDLLR